MNNFTSIALRVFVVSASIGIISMCISVQFRGIPSVKAIGMGIMAVCMIICVSAGIGYCIFREDTNQQTIELSETSDQDEMDF